MVTLSQAPFSALITESQGTVGFLCDMCQAYQDQVLLPAEMPPPSESRMSALVDLDLNIMWDSDCKTGDDAAVVWEKLSFGLDPLKYLSSVNRGEFGAFGNIESGKLKIFAVSAQR